MLFRSNRSPPSDLFRRVAIRRGTGQWEDAACRHLSSQRSLPRQVPHGRQVDARWSQISASRTPSGSHVSRFRSIRKIGFKNSRKIPNFKIRFLFTGLSKNCKKILFGFLKLRRFRICKNISCLSH